MVILRFLYRVVSSLGFGVVMLLLMGLILALATGYEASAGAEAVHFYFYHSWWFDLLLGLFLLSLTLATWRLRPYRWRHTGVIITHFSILLIALGALVTRHAGYEGRLRLPEGGGTDRLPTKEYALNLWQGDELITSWRLPLRTDWQKRELDDAYELPHGSVRLNRYLASAALRDTVRAAATGVPAYRLRLSGSGFDLRETLLTGHPELSRLQIGNHLQIETLPPVTATGWQDALTRWRATLGARALTLSFPALDLECSFNFSPQDTLFDIAGTPWQLAILREFANFSLDADNRPQDLPGEARNPALRFEIRGKGSVDRYTYFPRLPAFDPLHGREPQLARATVSWDPAGNHADTRILLAGDTSIADYHFAVATGTDMDRQQRGTELTLESPPLTITVEQTLPAAEAFQTVTEQEPGHGLPALNFTYSSPSGSGAPAWLLFGKSIPLSSTVVDSASSPAPRLYFERWSRPLGFTLRLLDFTEGKYPGSHQASSYSSLVEISNPATGEQFTQLIFMNQPLKYAGHKVFQSSFEPGRELEVSILSVNHDPGTPLVYVGCILLTVGLLVTYYLRKRLLKLEQRDQPATQATG